MGGRGADAMRASGRAGYMLTQIPGGYVTSRKGGRRVLPFGVGLWSAATAAVPLLAGTMPGAVAAKQYTLFRCAPGVRQVLYELVNTRVAPLWLSCIWTLIPGDWLKGVD